MEKEIDLKRHSLAHLMAAAVLKLYPQAKFGIGPVIENGFYYDIDLGDTTLSPEDLSKIQKLMKEVIKEKLVFEKQEVSLDEAVEIFKAKGQDYKLELLKDLKEKGTTLLEEIEELDSVNQVTIYTTGDFVDLCRGPHVEDSKKLKSTAFKLTKLAGAYWRGDENNKMLTRIYAVAFETKEELKEYLDNLAEAEKRDHRKLGKELDLFVFSDLVGPGLPIYTPKGTIVRNKIVEYSRELQKKVGYQEVHTPNINKAELFKVSGHYEKYKDDMIEVKSHYTKEDYFMKPMNCPHHTQVYAAQKRSYRDLPIRYNDFANLYRDEKPGELSGLTRLRCFSQDDGHSFCRPDQIKDEFLSLLGIVNESMKIYGMEYRIRLALWDPKHPEKYLGEAKVWEKSQKMLEDLLKDNKIEYEVEEGEAAIYGPKMDLVAKDSLGREFQLSTIQLDLIMPERFKLTYTDEKGAEQTPVMIHRAIIGSPERLMGILIEHYAGAFPLWLSPIQVKIISVGEGHIEYCQKLAQEFEDNNIRVEVDSANETVGNKIRKAVKERNPYMLVIGDKEMSSDQLAVRVRGSEEVVETKQDEFIEGIKNKVKDRSLEL
jgi:threonyl-tRNA synthetase